MEERVRVVMSYDIISEDRGYQKHRHKVEWMKLDHTR